MNPVKAVLFLVLSITSATLLTSCGSEVSGDIAATFLRTEYMAEPLGIDDAQPRFSWIIQSTERGVMQSAYQVLVATDPALLAQEQGDAWDSGKVNSQNSTQVVYDGDELESDQVYYWKIRVWDAAGERSAWSEPGSFQVGLTSEAQWNGDWVGTDTTVSAPILRKEFTPQKEVERAFVYIAGIGYYELYVNGEKIGDHRMDPGTTNYHKRILYETYDVTEYLKNDDNALGVWLGNGWYKHRGVQEYGDRPKLLLQMNIHYTDGTTMSVVSDESWKISESPITANSIWDGEIYDAQKEQSGWNAAGFDDSAWENAQVVDAPAGVLDSQIMPPIRVMETRQPVSMTEPEDGIYVFDFGRNFTGWPRLYVSGPAGTEITLQTAEITNRDMADMKEEPVQGNPDLVDTAPNRSAKARNIYTLSGEGNEIYEPRFTYQGFRYVQVTGFPGEMTPQNIEAQVAFSAVEQVGDFSASNTLLDSIHQNIIWGQQSNLHSMPTDCPQRDERLGWMGDAHLTGEEAMYNFDMAAFYTKWIKDIQDIQADSGSVTDVVPNHWEWLGTPAWQVAYPLMVWYMYQYYGDTRIIEDHYSNLKRWVDYMDGTTNEDHIVDWGRGDWVPPEKAYSPEDGSVPITSTGYLYRGAWIVSQFAEVLGNDGDAEQYASLAEELKNAINEQYLDTETNQYGSGSQTSNAFPLYLDIVPDASRDAVLANLTDDIMNKRDNHLWTGILGTKALVEALPRLGHSELMYTIASQRSFPSWGYMISKGATTLWERWGGYLNFDADMNSLNHIMFGSVAEYFYGDLAGIRPTSPGWETVSVRPHVVGDLISAEAETRTIRGTVSSSWEKSGQNFTLAVDIPANSMAEIAVPKLENESVTITESGQTVLENGQFAGGQSGFVSGSDAGDYIVFEVGSGAYEFEMNGE